MTSSAKSKAIRPEAYRLQGLPGLQVEMHISPRRVVIMENGEPC